MFNSLEILSEAPSLCRPLPVAGYPTFRFGLFEASLGNCVRFVLLFRVYVLVHANKITTPCDVVANTDSCSFLCKTYMLCTAQQTVDFLFFFEKQTVDFGCTFNQNFETLNFAHGAVFKKHILGECKTFCQLPTRPNQNNPQKTKTMTEKSKLKSVYPISSILHLFVSKIVFLPFRR